MPTFDYNGLSVHYVESGSGEPIVLLHAGASSGKQWRRVGERLDYRYRLISPDLIGFGQTPLWPGPNELTHDDQAGLVRTLIMMACTGAVHLVGHSYGGATAVRLFLAEPALVRALVLIEPILTPLLPQAGDHELFDEYERFAHRFIEQTEGGQEELAWESFIDVRNGPGTWRSLPEGSRTKFLGLSRQTADAFKSNLSNPTTLADCRAITVPTLIVCGGQTTAPERRVTEILRDEVPNSRYEVIPDGEHMSPLTHPAEVAQLIEGHLRTPAIRAGLQKRATQ